MRKEKDDADERNFRAFEELVRQAKEDKKSNKTVPNDTSVNVNPFSNEAVIDVPESPMLSKIREDRWADNNSLSQKTQILQQASTSEVDLQQSRDEYDSHAYSMNSDSKKVSNSEIREKWTKFNIVEEEEDATDDGVNDAPLDDSDIILALDETTSQEGDIVWTDSVNYVMGNNNILPSEIPPTTDLFELD
jgi:hypothetical protein